MLRIDDIHSSSDIGKTNNIIYTNTKTTLIRVSFFIVFSATHNYVVNITLAYENITHRKVNITRATNIT